jgi:hypothetical protein
VSKEQGNVEQTHRTPGCASFIGTVWPARTVVVASWANELHMRSMEFCHNRSQRGPALTLTSDEKHALTSSQSIKLKIHPR